MLDVNEVYVPAARLGTAKAETVNEIAESIMEIGLQVPISVRRGNGRYVLVSGLHRLEACRALGEETIMATVVGSPQH